MTVVVVVKAVETGRGKKGRKDRPFLADDNDEEKKKKKTINIAAAAARRDSFLSLSLSLPMNVLPTASEEKGKVRVLFLFKNLFSPSSRRNRR